MIVREVGRRIRQLRTSRSRMTQEELSERARISVSFLSMIERGERAPHLETLAAIAEALGVRLAELFAEGQERTGPDPVYGALIEACRRHNLDQRGVDLLVSMMRNMFAA